MSAIHFNRHVHLVLATVLITGSVWSVLSAAHQTHACPTAVESGISRNKLQAASQHVSPNQVNSQAAAQVSQLPAQQILQPGDGSVYKAHKTDSDKAQKVLPAVQ